MHHKRDKNLNHKTIPTLYTQQRKAQDTEHNREKPTQEKSHCNSAKHITQKVHQRQLALTLWVNKQKMQHAEPSLTNKTGLREFSQQHPWTRQTCKVLLTDYYEAEAGIQKDFQPS